MTKAEAFVALSPKWDFVADRSYKIGDYTIRVYVVNQVINGHVYELHCDSYMGDSILVIDGKRRVNVEINYDEALKDLV
jgi:hypothetical protein